MNSIFRTIACAGVITFCGCATPDEIAAMRLSRDVGDYATDSAEVLHSPNRKSAKHLKQSLYKLISDFERFRQKPPPGVCLHYATILAAEDNGRECEKYLEMEVANYPESSKLVEATRKSLQTLR
jgi:hypothetical protein